MKMTECDDLTETIVAARLEKTVRWLRDKISEDRRRPLNNQRLQFHYYIGRDKRWTEESYQAFRTAIIETSSYGKVSTYSPLKMIAAPMSSFQRRRQVDSSLEALTNFPLSDRRSGKSKK